MSLSIITSVVKFAVGVAYNKIKEHLFKPDTTVIDAILGGYAKLEHLISELDYMSRLHTPRVKIYFWVDRAKEVVENLRREDNPANREAYDNFIRALKSDSDGIRFQTSILYDTLTTPQSPVTPKGLLKFWADNAYNKLANENDTTYHTNDYILELDTNIAAVAALLHHGLELSMFISATETEAENFRRQAQDRIKTFRDLLFRDFYPPALRQIKSTYDDPGTFLTDGRMFNLYEEQVTTNKNFLTIHNYWIRQVLLHTPRGDSSAKVRAFRFAAQKPLGPLEMHAHWDYRGKTRVLFFNGLAAAKRVYAYTNSESSDTQRTLFKLIPVQDEGNSQRKRVKFIPYLQDNGSRTRADDNNTWGDNVETCGNNIADLNWMHGAMRRRELH